MVSINDVRVTGASQRGFTLIEILVAVAIVGVLAAIAVPAYQNHMIKVRRSDGQTALTQFAMAMERQYIKFGRYDAVATVANIFRDASDQGFYEMDIFSIAPASYILQAIPTGAQVLDTDCSTLRLDYLGNKTATGTAGDDSCW